MVAAYRGRAHARPVPLCSDPWAQALAGEEGNTLADDWDQHNPHGELWIATRTATIDRWLQQFTLPRGTLDQVILLGAGLDTRAARLARPGLQFFEVDHPHTQADRTQRLADLDGYPTGAGRSVPCDFERDDLLTVLGDAGFRFDAPAFVIWEGVVPYLTEEAVSRTLTDLARGLHADSVIVFDVVSRKMAEGRSSRSIDRALCDLVAQEGEPFLFGLDDPVPLLSSCGFRHVRTLSFDEACLSLTGSYERERAFRFQSFVVTSRENPLSL
jgi:methyltransferase (TIGR00027 family)